MLKILNTKIRLHVFFGSYPFVPTYCLCIYYMYIACIIRFPNDINGFDAAIFFLPTQALSVGI